MPDVIYDTNGKLSVGSYHMWRLYPTRITTRLDLYEAVVCLPSLLTLG